ncbi:hypothetical protein JKP88DRAFT_256400 [Tribonema minus]|uniref:Cation-transporting P-type ATPase N-terminal domain-containing protein n=1 Tax=Tribonema minus TaxID=303371 RepID=A0A835ZC90_9STRA|nr:hypothetical protein JKP88DRAFT_256400 [Tribonema minus]
MAHLAELPRGAAPRQPSARATHAGFTSSVKGGDIETGKRRTITLAEATRYRTRGRIIAVSRRSTDLPTIKEAAAAGKQPVGEDVDDHFLTVARLAERYSVDLDLEDPAKSQGLSPEEAQRRLDTEGLNALTPPKEDSLIIQYLRLLKDPLTAMLLLAAALSLASQAAADEGDYTPIYLGMVLLVVTLANTTVDFVQARKSAAMVKSLSALAPAKAMVLRGGAAVEVNASQLARGEVTMLKAGDKVPADIRLVKVTEMTVDNSNLTGEGDPQKRAVTADSPAVLEAENLVFMGTTVVAGAGIGVVIRRGDESVLGKISTLAGASKDDMQSPLTKEIKAFVLLMGGIAFFFAVLLFGIGMARGVSFTNSLSLGIGIFVAFALCGMPATVTMLLAYASKQLSKHNVLVKNLHAMDTLGAITLLCSDKTGTLTMNVMTVVETWRFGRNNTDTDSVEPLEAASADVHQDKLRLCMVLCNSAHFVSSEENLALPVSERAVIGDATETALLRHVANSDSVDDLRATYLPALEVPFSSDRKWAAGVFTNADGLYTVYLKGAPERVIRRCTQYYKHGPGGAVEFCPMDSGLQEAFQATYEKMAGRGQRVIACAALDLPASTYPKGTEFDAETFPSENMVFLGLVALQDPPKPGVTGAIDECNTAGIQVMMITGDHPLTAEAIAREVSSYERNSNTPSTTALLAQVKLDQFEAVVLHGETLATMSEEEWAEALSKREVVFARTSPQQKLEIVTRSQAMGHVVAMIGDGVNDSPALRRADMGIAMAMTGSEVSREAASLVLLDDNFTSVIVGIKRGRIIFSNMKKAVCCTLGHIMGEIFPAILLLVLGLPLGMSSFLILFIDLGTEIAPVMSFAFEEGDADVMERPPRRAIVPRDVVVDLDEERRLLDLTDMEIAEADKDEIEEEVERGQSKLGALGNRLYRGVIRMTNSSKMPFRSGGKDDLPTNPGDERLVDMHAVIFAFVQNGFFGVATGLVVYFLVFNHYGVPPSSLMGAAPEFFPATNGDTFEADGKTFSPGRQEDILNSVQSAYYFTIAITQFFTAYILKATDPNPFCSPKAWVNKWTYLAMVFSTAIAFFVTFTPGVQTVLGSNNFPLWALPVAFAGGLVHVAFEAVKRFVMRQVRKKKAAKPAGSPVADDSNSSTMLTGSAQVA